MGRFLWINNYNWRAISIEMKMKKKKMKIMNMVMIIIRNNVKISTWVNFKEIRRCMRESSNLTFYNLAPKIS